MILLFVSLYLLLQLVISLIVSLSIKSESDFFLAGRKLPLWLLSFSLFATWFGAETTIGTAGAVFNEGLAGSRADPFGYSLCLFLMGILLARKLWQGGYTTLADFFKARFDGKVEKLAVMIMVPSTLLWGAAQMRAFGQVVTSMTDWDLNQSLWVAFAFVTLYTLLGGLLGDIITDLVQGIMMAIGLVLIFYFVVESDFDLAQWWNTLPAERLSFQKAGESWWQRIDRWSIPIFGSLVAQELISRVLSAKSATVARNSAFTSGLIYLFFGSIPVILGLIGPSVLGSLPHHEDFIITLAQKYLPTFAFVIFSGALISAILATIDSILLSASALVSHNIVVPLFKIKKEKHKVLSARALVVLSSLGSVIVAFSSESIYQLVEVASSFGTAGILVISIFGLHFSWGGRISAIFALVVGLVAMPLSEYVLELQAPFVTTILVTFVAYVAGAFIPDKANAEQASLSEEPHGDSLNSLEQGGNDGHDQDISDRSVFKKGSR